MLNLQRYLSVKVLNFTIRMRKHLLEVFFYSLHSIKHRQTSFTCLITTGHIKPATARSLPE